MSAFAQHDEMDVVLVESEVECRLCAHPVLIDEITLINPWQLIDSKPSHICEAVQSVCERCWWKAWHYAKPENVIHTDEMHFIIGVPKEEES